MSEPLAEFALPGLHAHVAGLLPAPSGARRAVDLGTGSGAFAQRLADAGWLVEAADLDGARYRGSAPFVEVDLRSDALPLAEGGYELVTAIEVIEHLEAPLQLLRHLAGLLAPTGVAVVTTPNVDSLPARLKFLLQGRLRAMDEHGDPTHISPIFWDLLHRRLLPLAGLRLVEHHAFPPHGFVAGRPRYHRVLNALGRVLPPPLVGDCHVFVLARATG